MFWLTWSALFAGVLVAAVLYARAAVIAVRRDGFGKGRSFTGAAARWSWAGTAVIVVDGLLMWGWVTTL